MRSSDFKEVFMISRATVDSENPKNCSNFHTNEYECMFLDISDTRCSLFRKELVFKQYPEVSFERCDECLCHEVRKDSFTEVDR